MKKILETIKFNITFYWYILKTLFSLWKATRKPSNLKKVREIVDSLKNKKTAILKKSENE